MTPRVRRAHIKPRVHPGTKAHEVGADGEQFFSRSQAAKVLGIGERTLRLWQESGRFVPALQRRGVWLYTRAQLDEQRKEMPGELAAIAFAHFEQGATPVQLVIKLRCDPSSIANLHASYVHMTGAWTVAGPPGSRQSWEATYGIGELTADKLRRALELCASDARLKAKLLGEVPKETLELDGSGVRALELVSNAAKQSG